jgi:hypothetical protein
MTTESTEIVDLPMNSMVIIHSCVNVYQRLFLAPVLCFHLAPQRRCGASGAHTTRAGCHESACAAYSCSHGESGALGGTMVGLRFSPETC